MEQARNRSSLYLVAILIRAKNSQNERDNADMVLVVPALPHKPWGHRLRLGSWRAQVAKTHTLPANILAPFSEHRFFGSAFATELLAPRTQEC